MRRNVRASVTADTQHNKAFAEHKRRILASLGNMTGDVSVDSAAAGVPALGTDRSPKGSVDVKCAPILRLLNEHEDYVTTSSCSGRIALFHRVDTDDTASTCTVRSSHTRQSTRYDTAGAHRDDTNAATHGSACAAAGEAMRTAAATSTTQHADAAAHDTSTSIAAAQRSPASVQSKMKRGDTTALGWVFVKHGALRAHEMQQIVDLVCGHATDDDVSDRTLDEQQRQVAQHAEAAAAAAAAVTASTVATPRDVDDGSGAYDGEVDGALCQGAHELARDTAAAAARATMTRVVAALREQLARRGGTLSLKMEPFVLHVQCRSMAAARSLLAAAVADSGYRNSGMTPPGRHIVCAIRATAGHSLDVPLMLDGVNYAAGQRAYVWSILHLANRKMLENARRMALLARAIAARLGSDAPLATTRAASAARADMHASTIA